DTESIEKSRLQESSLYVYLEDCSAQKLVMIIRNSRMFFSFKEGREVESFLKSEIYKKDFTQEDKTRLYLESAKLEAYAKNYDEGIFYLSSCLEQKSSNETEAEVFIWFAFVYDAKSLFETEKMYARLAMSKVAKSSYLYALALLRTHLGEDQLEKKTSVEQFHELLTLLKKFKLTNSYINASLFIPKQLFQDKDRLPSLLNHLDTSIQKAKEIGNFYALSTGYHWKSILISMQGDNEQSLLFNKKCHNLRLEVSDMLSRIKSGNGLAYKYLLKADYLYSYTIGNEFLSQVFKYADKGEVVMTFYNAGKTLFFGRDFKKAYIVIQKAQHLMKVFKVLDSFFCNSNDFILIKAYIDFIDGHEVQSKTAVYNVQNNGRDLSWYLKVLLEFLQALYALEKNKISKSESLFESAFQKAASLEHQRAFMSFEYAIQLHKAGKTTLASKYHLKGARVAKENNFKHYVENFASFSPAEYQTFSVPFDELSVNLDFVEEMVSKELLVNRVHRKMQESHFLNHIASLGMRFSNTKDYVASFCQHFFNYTFVNAIFVAQKTNEKKWVLIGTSALPEVPVPTEKKWQKLYDQEKKASVFQVTRVGKNSFFVNLSQFNFVYCLIFETSQGMPLSFEESGVLQIAFSHLQSSLIIYQQNNELYRLSTTDDLTGLYNRRALGEKMRQASDMFRQGVENKLANVTLIFIDLDNFKFYNDEFGHKVGDYVLQCFARILTEVVRTSDSLYRYGGDEFIIFTLDVRTPNPERVVSRIRKKLIEEDYLIPLLEKKLNKKLDIPVSKRIGFSAGISTSKDILPECDCDKLLQLADAAMYEAKENGKNLTITYGAK
ncbi:MAG TPA: GGDEF domain-containing protein, partial [Treponemataceae bacterium]|nr:GGDEF domain-containing protein [Treponemataceae bacterium]